MAALVAKKSCEVRCGRGCRRSKVSQSTVPDGPLQGRAASRRPSTGMGQPTTRQAQKSRKSSKRNLFRSQFLKSVNCIRWIDPRCVIPCFMRLLDWFGLVQEYARGVKIFQHFFCSNYFRHSPSVSGPYEDCFRTQLNARSTALICTTWLIGVYMSEPLDAVVTISGA